jgi:hypothetical protein
LLLPASNSCLGQILRWTFLLTVFDTRKKAAAMHAIKTLDVFRLLYQAALTANPAGHPASLGAGIAD